MMPSDAIKHSYSPKNVSANARRMMHLLVNWVLEELKKTPIALVGVCVIGFYVYDLKQDHVSIMQFNTLQKQVLGVQFTLQRDHVDTRLHQVQQERFALSQHILEEREKGHPIDALYSSRLEELGHQETEQIDLLQRLDHGQAPITQ